MDNVPRRDNLSVIEIAFTQLSATGEPRQISAKRFAALNDQRGFEAVIDNGARLSVWESGPVCQARIYWGKEDPYDLGPVIARDLLDVVNPAGGNKAASMAKVTSCLAGFQAQHFPREGPYGLLHRPPEPTVIEHARDSLKKIGRPTIRQQEYRWKLALAPLPVLGSLFGIYHASKTGNPPIMGSAVGGVLGTAYAMYFSTGRTEGLMELEPTSSPFWERAQERYKRLYTGAAVLGLLASVIVKKDNVLDALYVAGSLVGVRRLGRLAGRGDRKEHSRSVNNTL